MNANFATFYNELLQLAQKHVDKLPYDLVEIVEKIKPKTSLIKQKLEAGEEVAGAHLERTEDYITIRGGALCRISQTSN